MADEGRRKWIAAGVLLGIGLGGFVDGILFHQILQLHNMLSNRIPPTSVPALEINMVWDGLFHAFCLVAVLAGLALSWRALKPLPTFPSGRGYAGALIAGWGVFNLVEGVIDHHLLGLHHVVQSGAHLPWDLAFLALGGALLGTGWALLRSDGRRDATPEAPVRRRTTTQAR